MNFGIAGGYNVSPIVWQNDRRKVMQRAFNFAAEERKQNEGGE
jgi:hypothetical protein